MPASAKAYAKINLALDITGKREDGYHLLRMVMQSVSLYDEVEIRTGEAGLRVVCSHRSVPCDESNAVYKAAAAFFKHTGLEPDVAIRIHKTIPSQAGLGGASADAAAVLRLLNTLKGTALSKETLCALGLQVGADVPFCIAGGTALAEGIGEKLTPLTPLPSCRIVICKPAVSVDTTRAYALADAAAKTGSGYCDAVLDAVRASDIRAVAASLGNEFEQVMHLAEVKHIKDAMRDLGALGACMTGSGSAVFGIFTDLQDAARCRAKLQEYYSEVFLCEPVHEITL
ncbi:4-(cytidine 5'-diphospho)-2-C-methyl-D-erythritol kinase [Caproiciproducens galactitolivorans]|uniref:4-diphosphocytidyl-2-C-methyl-D-erythritol kinase n=1 Tax=Caproiciproducens galactitolivorans TaxID=642589 RepID=A0A4Z0YGX2_9FIRM|nr:4-(cytidine 5'-diphospho)-2-C-methyl-D-erythritol kinase [Caproiciproducens galactitolivorans]QEY34247.1 4-(cytidine 5'-diphospho)-2-C-methyl-D-erythritol kinase [Caproiciproducens galactitolivorans]TGJ77993.1 4-diphosphocytidyl-2-C-methyl-D-erythritol kinase [Caproiciproducens galactitolivorans]